VQLLCGEEIAAGRRSAAQSANFVYLVANTATHRAVVFDAAWDVGGVLEAAELLEVDIVASIYTHNHYDHTGGKLSGGRVLEGAREVRELLFEDL
jgi:glyoxylase-like metal-dependent hydrolase (beta-lactamase superfamily II)